MASQISIRHAKALLQLQVVAGVAFLLLALSLPIYMFVRHGLDTGPVYDGAGQVIGQINYFVAGLAMGLFGAGVSLFAIFMARRSLRLMNRVKG